MQNILVDEKFTAKVADFGLSITDENVAMHNEEAGTYRYMSPERLEGEPASPRSDVFSFSIIIWELYTGTKAFPQMPVDEVIASVRKSNMRPTPTTPLNVREDVRVNARVLGSKLGA